VNEHELNNFRDFVNRNPDVQRLVSAVNSPEQIVELATSRGFALSTTDLLIGAREWNESHWVWAGQPKQFFRFFFHEGRLPGPSELNAG
jgi:hypothetical protein